MIPLVVIRPQPGCAATVQAAQGMGLDAFGHPLFEIVPLGWQAPDAASFDALLIGSANALRHGGPALERYRGIPAYAVGETCAAAVRDAGLDVAGIGEGGLQALLGSLHRDHSRLLRLTGRERVALSPPPGISIVERVTYASEPQLMSPELAKVLAGDALVLLHSGEAAKHFVAQCDAQGIARGAIVIAALAPRIAEIAGGGWAAIEAAPVPRDQALLALASQMCQNARQLDT
jgi:uroporphyrinogen-III synthase